MKSSQLNKPPSNKPTIGFFGGTNNNMYLYAKIFHRLGTDVRYIRQRYDKFAHSQPVWEDCYLTLPFDDVMAMNEADWERWNTVEAELSWTPPTWLIDTRVTGIAPPQKYSWLSVLKGKVSRRFASVCPELLRRVKPCFEDCDLLVICGVTEALLAASLGKPYVIVPHGADIRWAAGHLPRQPESRSDRCQLVRTTRHLKRAFTDSLFVAGGAPNWNGTADLAAQEHLPHCRFRYIPFPVPGHNRPSPDSRRKNLNYTLARLGQPPISAPCVIFCPARLDFKWKGQNHLLQALTQGDHRNHFHLIVPDWGVDRAQFTQICRNRGLESSITRLPFMLSKPYVYDLYMGSNIVVDHFLHGIYGGITFEAASFGTPVLMNLATDLYHQQDMLPPPVLQATNSTQIANVLHNIRNGTLDLESSGQKIHQWFAETHDARLVHDRFMALLGDVCPQFATD